MFFFEYLRLAHLAGTGSERKRPGLVAVVVVVLPFWASAQAATRQKVANAKVTFIWKKKRGKEKFKAYVIFV